MAIAATCVSGSSSLVRIGRSKCQFHSKLNLPVIGSRCGDPSLVPAVASRRSKDNVTWLHEVGMVEQIEKLGSELQIHSLSQGRIFDQSKVCVKEPRPNNRVSAQVAEGPSRRKREGARIIVQRRDTHLLSRGYPWATGGHSLRGIVAIRVDISNCDYLQTVLSYFHESTDHR